MVADMYWYERVDTVPKLGRLWGIAEAGRKIATYCLDIKGDEDVVIVADTEVSPLVYHGIAAAIRAHGAEVTVSVMAPLPHPNAEPPAAIAGAMAEADITIATVSRTITHTKARERATQELGRRYLLSPNTTEDMMIRGAAQADLEVVAATTLQTAKALSKGNRVRVTSEHGTDVEFSVEGRPFKGYFGKCHRPGDVQVFPGGEANTLPVEETINGTVVFDSMVMEVGLVEEPIRVTFENGIATAIEGGREATILRDIIESTNSKDSYRLGEFSVGTNYAARVVGNAFEDKQVYGSVHIALGSPVMWPKYYRPDWHAPIHLDGVILSPTIELDGDVVVSNRTIHVADDPYDRG